LLKLIFVLILLAIIKSISSLFKCWKRIWLFSVVAAHKTTPLECVMETVNTIFWLSSLTALISSKVNSIGNVWSKIVNSSDSLRSTAWLAMTKPRSAPINGHVFWFAGVCWTEPIIVVPILGPEVRHYSLKSTKSKY